MVGRRRSAGFSMLEGVIALALVMTVAGAFLWSGPQQARATAASFRAAVARRAADAVLETSRGRALQPGRETLPLPEGVVLDRALVEREVRVVEPGLVEVEASVTWREPGETSSRTERLTTWIATEASR